MKSRTLLAAAICATVGGVAYAAAFHGRLMCDQDPRAASSASCMIFPADNGSALRDQLSYQVIESASGEPWMIYDPDIDGMTTNNSSSSSAELIAKYGVDSATAGFDSEAGAGEYLLVTDVSEPMFVTYYLIEPGWNTY